MKKSHLWVVICLLACAATGWKIMVGRIHSKSSVVAVKCSIEGDFGIGKPWSLEVQPDGTARLSIQNYNKPQVRKFKVSPVQLAALIKVIETEHFFDLDNKYGGEVPDGSTRTLSIVRGNESKTVVMEYLENDNRLAEIKRAIHVWNTVRQWFTDAEAVDLRQYDQHLLDAS